MQTRNIDVCLINQTDEFQNEFLPTYSQRLQWLTNFSGSAGEAIITMSKAYLFVDGRYTLQAKNEVNKNIYKVYNYTEKTPTEILKSFKEIEDDKDSPLKSAFFKKAKKFWNNK